MLYEMKVSGAPKPLQSSGVFATPPSGLHRQPRVQRFVPMLQFLTPVPAYVEAQLRSISVQCHQQGLSIDQICRRLHHHAQTLGYEVTLSYQEAHSAHMPSFQGQTVISALIMLDSKPIPMQHQPPLRHAM